MPDNELRFRTVVDLSGLEAGTEEITEMMTAAAEGSAAAVSASSQTIEEAYAQLEAQGLQTMEALNEALEKNVAAHQEAEAATKKATEAMKDESAEIGILDAAYRQQAAATIELQAAHGRLRDAYKQLGPIAHESSDAMRIIAQYEREDQAASEQLIIAKRNLKEVREYEDLQIRESILELNGEADAHRNAAQGALEHAEAEEKVSKMQAASATVGLLEGRGTRRAAERGLSMLPGAGEMMAEAFPYVAGAAIAMDILGPMAEKVHKIFEEFDQVRQAEIRVSEQLKTLNADFEQSVQKAESLRYAYTETMNTRFANGRMVSGRPAALREHVESQQLTVSSDDISRIRQAQEEIDKLNKRIAEGTVSASRPDIGVTSKTTFITEDAKAAQKELEAANTKLENAQLNHSNNMKQLAIYQRQLQNEEAQQEYEESQRSGEKALQGLQENLNQQKIALQENVGKKMTGGQEADYWKSHLEELRKYPDQYREVISKIRSAEQGSQSDEVTSITRPKVERQTRFMSELDMQDPMKAFKGGMGGTPQQWEQYNSAVDKNSAILARNKEAQEEINLAIGVATGSIGPYSAAQQEAAIHTAFYTDELARLRAEIERIKSDPNLTEAQKQTKIQGANNQMDQVRGQAGVSSTKDQAAISNSISQPFVRGIDTINNSWLQMQNKLIFGTRNVGAAFANMGVSMLESVAGNFEQMVVKFAESQIRMTIAHQIAKATQSTTDKIAAAESDLTSETSALKQITHWATVAAAKAWSAFSDIPVVGPVLGAAAAAATFIGIEALAAFETGGLIPNTGVALVHQGEAVLPAGLTNFLMNAAGNSTTNNSARMTQTNNFGGLSDSQFKRQANRNSATLLSAARRQLRNRGHA